MSREEVRIGVYVCHCGTNIAGVVNVEEVVEYIKKIPGVVVARHYVYMCSEAGQNLIKQDIKEHKLNRVVVASCSPNLHENTFRRAVAEAGLNPYYFQMANIREHCSWVTEDPKEATEKAKMIVRAAVERVKYHEPLEKKKVEVKDKILVVGGGIAGISAALVCANAGKTVYLVEKSPSIGGMMSRLDKTFPTLDCAACILTPKMNEVASHPNIKLITYAEVESVEGFVGNFKVRIRKKPRYVIEDLCVGCEKCVEACVFKEPKFYDEWSFGLKKRKPVYIPFPYAVPRKAIIDPESCLYLKYGRCKQTCVEACDRNAIDFNQKEEIIEVEVGAIILATGYKFIDVSKLPQYGYGKYPNVYIAPEVEVMLNASGPTRGEIILRDGRKPKSVAIIHCVGSRDENNKKYCSRLCCMAAIKLAHLIKERTEAEVYNFYIDIRAAGKGYEEFYKRVASEGVRFIRGKVAEITDVALTPEEEGKLIVRVEDTLAGVIRRIPVDMVVLMPALEPATGVEEVSKMFGVSVTEDFWFLERHPKLAPIATFADGIFLAGCCQGPKDIPDTVMQAEGAAGDALALVSRGYIELEPNIVSIDPEKCSGCRVCVGMCPFGALKYNEEKGVTEVIEALCKGCGTCAAACPSGAIQQNLFKDKQVYAEIAGILAVGGE
mgnify:CR=1 FL=1